MNILVSACLLGVPCRYDGKSKPCGAVVKLGERHCLIPVCPEVLGGLETPRPPAELQPDGSVRNRAGEDVTRQYREGAGKALRLAQDKECVLAILKEKSPSCGCGRIYDGSFTGALTAGNGVCATLLMQHGIPVIGESEAETRADAEDFLRA